jgi:hypothetical protein
MIKRLIDCSDKILVWDDVANDLPVLKKDILNEYEKRKDFLIEHHTGYRMPMDESMPSNNKLDEYFAPCLKEYIKEFKLGTEDNYFFSQWILIGWTVEDRGMPLHNDHMADVSFTNPDFQQPFLTAIFYLSHECEGGNLEFPDSNFILKPNSGTLIIFPSELNHEVLNYISGERIVIQKFVFPYQISP